MLTLILSFYIVQGHSMEPQYHHDDRVTVIHAPCPEGSTIAFEYENVTYIKNLVKYTADGKIYVLGRTDRWTENGELRQSYDSHIYGYIKDYKLLGCVL